MEGLLRDVLADLGAEQPLRRIQNEAAYTKIESILERIREVLADEPDEGEESTTGQVQVPRASQKDAPMKPFTVMLDDPAGNSFIEFVGNMSDPKWNMRTYRRTRQQNIDLGLINPDAEPETETEAEIQTVGTEGTNEEIFIFHGTCSSCGHKCDTLMKRVNIPYFKASLNPNFPE